MSSLTREEVLQYLEKFTEAAWSSGPDIGKLLAHDAAQRATIEAQAQRIAKLEAECQEQSTAKTAFFHGMNDMRDERERLRHELNKQAQRIRELEQENARLKNENEALRKYTPWAL